MPRAYTETELADAASRRGLIGVVAVLAAASIPASGATVAAPGRPVTAPLKRDLIDYACVQSPVWPLDPDDARAGKRKNVAYMARLLDEHANSGAVADVLSFHELAIGGFMYWTRAEMLNVAIDVPGEETEVLSRKAREYGLWITFGCYARDPDWPGHVLMLGVIIDPTGAIVAKHWKTRGSHGRGQELLTSTVYDCLPRFVEMYGWDATMPVSRTPVGNISITGVQYEPMTYVAMALKGCELCVRQASRSNPDDDIAITARYNGFYSSLVTNSVSPGHRYFPDFAGAFGITQIVGPGGERLARVNSGEEEIVRASLPLAAYRRSHLVPDVQWDMYAPLFAAYRPRFESGAFLDRLPPTMAEAATQFIARDQWK